MKRYFDREYCSGCGNCIRSCPKGILKLDEKENRIVVTDEAACVGCRNCETMCTKGAFWFSDDGNMPEDIRIMGRELLPDHAGCQFGIIAHMLARAIVRTGMRNSVKIFGSDRAEANLSVDREGIPAPYFFEKALEYKKEHPERIVVIFYSDPKEKPHADAAERFLKLKDENVTLIHCLGNFRQTDQYAGFEDPSRHLAEEMAGNGNAKFAARGNVTVPSAALKTERYMEAALKKQAEGIGPSVVEIVFPCFFRLEGRPALPICPERRELIRDWFADRVVPEYPAGTIKE